MERTLNWLPRRPSTLARPQLLWRPWTIIITARVYWALTMHPVLCAKYLTHMTLHWIWIPKCDGGGFPSCGPNISFYLSLLPMHPYLKPKRITLYCFYFQLYFAQSFPPGLPFPTQAIRMLATLPGLACMLTLPWKFSLGRISLMNTNETLNLIQYHLNAFRNPTLMLSVLITKIRHCSL